MRIYTVHFSSVDPVKGAIEHSHRVEIRGFESLGWLFEKLRIEFGLQEHSIHGLTQGRNFHPLQPSRELKSTLAECFVLEESTKLVLSLNTHPFPCVEKRLSLRKALRKTYGKSERMIRQKVGKEELELSCYARLLGQGARDPSSPLAMIPPEIHFKIIEWCAPSLTYSEIREIFARCYSRPVTLSSIEISSHDDLFSNNLLYNGDDYDYLVAIRNHALPPFAQRIDHLIDRIAEREIDDETRFPSFQRICLMGGDEAVRYGWKREENNSSPIRLSDLLLSSAQALHSPHANHEALSITISLGEKESSLCRKEIGRYLFSLRRLLRGREVDLLHRIDLCYWLNITLQPKPVQIERSADNFFQRSFRNGIVEWVNHLEKGQEFYGRRIFLNGLIEVGHFSPSTLQLISGYRLHRDLITFVHPQELLTYEEGKDHGFIVTEYENQLVVVEKWLHRHYFLREGLSVEPLLVAAMKRSNCSFTKVTALINHHLFLPRKNSFLSSLLMRGGDLFLSIADEQIALLILDHLIQRGDLAKVEHSMRVKLVLGAAASHHCDLLCRLALIYQEILPSIVERVIDLLFFRSHLCDKAVHALSHIKKLIPMDSANPLLGFMIEEIASWRDQQPKELTPYFKECFSKLAVQYQHKLYELSFQAMNPLLYEPAAYPPAADEYSLHLCWMAPRSYLEKLLIGWLDHHPKTAITLWFLDTTSVDKVRMRPWLLQRNLLTKIRLRSLQSIDDSIFFDGQPNQSWRALAQSMIINQVALEESARFIVYTDERTVPCSREALFDARTMKWLNEYGMVMKKHRRRGFSMGFQIMDRTNAKLLELHREVVCDETLKMASHSNVIRSGYERVFRRYLDEMMVDWRRDGVPTKVVAPCKYPLSYS